VAVGTEAGFRRYYPIAHEPGGNLDADKVFMWLDRELSTETPKIGAHLLYDMGFLEESGVHMGGPMWDVQNAEPLLNENKFTYSLESLSRQYLGIGKIDEELDEFLITHFGKKNPKNSIWRAPPDIVAPYAIGDVNHPIEIFHQQRPELERQGLWRIFEVESRLIPLLYKMRRRGVAVDLDRAEEMYDRMTGEQEVAQAKIKHLTGMDVAVWASDSLAQAFDRMGLRYPRTPKTRKPSFTKDTLSRVSHKLGEMVLEVRRLDKMRGTFLMGCILEGHYKGRVYCQFNQQRGEDGGAVSGRFSSSNPNLQFIPVRTEEGKLLRSMFIADHGEDWWKMDYSQIEFRLMVHDAMWAGLPGAAAIGQQYIDDPDTDFHEVVAEIVYGAEFTDEHRRRGKTINFGIAFGEGEPKLATQLGVPKDQAAAIIAEYHRKIPFMSKLADQLKSEANRKGEVETLLGRLRRFPWGKTKWNDDGSNETTIFQHRVPGARRAFTHKALNARIQGSAADVLKEGMVQAYESGVFDELGMVQLTVHDELDGSMPKTRRARQALRELQDILEKCVDLKVPLVVDVSTGPNWGEQEDADTDAPPFRPDGSPIHPDALPPAGM
jgi:DNA polymerase I-like protein with 3'-5' exonuclease and polymerase domains